MSGATPAAAQPRPGFARAAAESPSAEQLALAVLRKWQRKNPIFTHSAKVLSMRIPPRGYATMRLQHGKVLGIEVWT